VSLASVIRPLYSGELARLSGMSADTVRHYERHGLLPVAPRSATGYRLFPREAVARMQLVRAALSIGFSVSELSDILRERKNGRAPCRRVRDMAADKLLTLESRIRDLQSWRRDLRITLAQWDSLLAKTPRGKQARLLEALAVTHPKSRTRRSDLGVLARGNQRGESKK
jgi:MerR family transcriptional regulator, Zn(II)-responsive regulator of zntA